MINSEYNGICSNCTHAIECKFRKESAEVIFYCNEYELVDSNCTILNPLSATKNNNQHSSNLSSSLKGLCCNCDNFTKCTLQKPDAGVWHCEEYI